MIIIFFRKYTELGSGCFCPNAIPQEQKLGSVSRPGEKPSGVWNQFSTRFAENLSNQISRTYWFNPSLQLFSCQNWRNSNVLSVSFWGLSSPPRPSPFSMASPSPFLFSLSNLLLPPHHQYPPKIEASPLGHLS